MRYIAGQEKKATIEDGKLRKPVSPIMGIGLEVWYSAAPQAIERNKVNVYR